MFGKLFKRNTAPQWETSMQKGIMVRKCRRSGRLEYRDCKNLLWVHIESEEKLKSIQDKLRYFTPTSIEVR